MSRLEAATDRDALSDEVRQAYDTIAGNRGRVGGPIAVMLPYAPEAALRLSRIGDALRFESTLSRAQVELATITAARAVDCAYVWAAHCPPALEAGVPQSVVDVVDSRGPLDSLSDDDALIVQFGRELIEQRNLPRDTFDRARARFGERGVVELAALLGFYVMISCIITGVDLQPAPDRPRLSTTRGRA